MNYTTLFKRLLSASGKMSPYRAAVLGVHWHRWVMRARPAHWA